mmetsp:Transcript_74679/g.124588  ORF Transcript_74679/g.124588 Transcript_74679/m.124588 type:complete len:410 (-) Transcript_74679:130-1359(-)
MLRVHLLCSNIPVDSQPAARQLAAYTFRLSTPTVLHVSPPAPYTRPPLASHLHHTLRLNQPEAPSPSPLALLPPPPSPPPRPPRPTDWSRYFPRPPPPPLPTGPPPPADSPRIGMRLAAEQLMWQLSPVAVAFALGVTGFALCLVAVLLRCLQLHRAGRAVRWRRVQHETSTNCSASVSRAPGSTTTGCRRSRSSRHTKPSATGIASCQPMEASVDVANIEQIVQAKRHNQWQVSLAQVKSPSELEAATNAEKHIPAKEATKGLTAAISEADAAADGEGTALACSGAWACSRSVGNKEGVHNVSTGGGSDNDDDGTIPVKLLWGGQQGEINLPMSEAKSVDAIVSSLSVRASSLFEMIIKPSMVRIEYKHRDALGSSRRLAVSWRTNIRTLRRAEALFMTRRHDPMDVE